MKKWLNSLRQRSSSLGVKIAFAVFSLAVLYPAVASSNPPTPYKHFRYSLAQMQEIANPHKLAHRIFYTEPSMGIYAAWFDAVKRGDLATVKSMVEHGQNIEVKDRASLGQTALLWAAFIGYEDIVDYLLSKGANLHAQDKGDVFNALKSAVLGNNLAVVKKLHRLMWDETDINDQKKDKQGETFVMIAASNNRLDIVKYFIGLGANLNLVTTQPIHGHYQSALSYACERGYTEMQQLLIAHGAINNLTGKSNCQ